MGQSVSSHQDKNAGGDVREHEPNFRGPVSKRSCTDLFCGLIFFLFVLVFVVLGIWSFAMGDARVIIYPKDSEGKICGLTYPNKKYLFFFDITACLKVGDTISSFGCNTPQVCVEKCPDEFWSFEKKNNDDTTEREKMICIGGTNANNETYKSKTIEQLVSEKLCASYMLKSKSVFRRCIPSDFQKNGEAKLNLKASDKHLIDNNELIKSTGLILNTQSILTRVIYDLLRTWKFILLGFVVAAVISLLWIILLRFFATIMVYMTLLLFLILFCSGSICCFLKWKKLKENTSNNEHLYLTIDLTVYLRQANTWLALGIISGIIFIIILLMIIFLRKRIQMAIAIFQETSKAVQSMMSTLLWPLVPFILIAGALFYGVFVDIHLRSMVTAEGVLISTPSKNAIKEVVKNAIMCNPDEVSTGGKICHFVRYGGKRYVIFLQIYNLIMTVWLVNFVRALGEMTLAGAFATYYFSQDNPAKYMPRAPLLMSFGRAIFYHFGSLALGSLLITSLSFFRAVMLFIERRLKLSENPVAQFFMKCMCCCFWLLDKILRFLNRNAYIMVAIYSHNFCRSAADAFGLITRNIARVFVVDNVTNFVLFVGKLVVAGVTGAVAYFCFEGAFAHYHGVFAVYEPKLNYPLIPVFFVVIGSYLISKIFFSVYEMGVDTIFICFCEDLERNDGSSEKPYFMRHSLMNKLGKSASSEETRLNN